MLGVRSGVMRLGGSLLLAIFICTAADTGARAASAFGGPMTTVVAQTIPGVPWPVLTAGSVTQAHMLVVCAQFAGQKGKEPIATYRQIYFGQRNSVADYYRHVSFGQLQLTGTVVGDPQHPDRYLQLAHTEAYYAGADNGTGSPYPHDDNQLVADVIYALIADHFNFAPYEQDGQLPYLAIVFSGYGADVDPSDPGLIWPVENGFNEPVAVPVAGATATNEKYLMVSNYDLVPELDQSGDAPTIGVFAHELGHLFGLDDLYDTSDASNAGQGDGPWSLMATGNWNGFVQGAQPAELDPWSRILLGWIHPLVIDESVTGLRLPPIEKEPVVYELAPLGGGTQHMSWLTDTAASAGPVGLAAAKAPKDFFLIDNVQSLSYDRGLPGTGVMIWHIDGSQAIPGSYDWENNVLNAPSQNKTHHYDEQVVEAGGTSTLQEPTSQEGALDDTYPSNQGHDQFTATSRPSNRLWDGQSVGISVSRIAVQPDGVATMDVVDQQSGQALVIARPSTGLIAYQGVPVSLKASALSGGQWSEVSTDVTWHSTSAGAQIQGSQVVFRQTGYVSVSAQYGKLQALLELQVLPAKR